MFRRITDHFEPIIATLLGIAAIAAAFAAYQSGQESGVVTEKLTETAAGATVAFSRLTNGMQQTFRDEHLWIEYWKADEGDNPDLAAHIQTALMDEDLQKAVRDAEDPDSETLAPMQSQKYVNDHEAQALELAEESDAAYAEAQSAGERGDRYDLAVVILAVALFFFGVAGVMSAAGTRLALAGTGSVILVVALVVIATV